MKLLPCFSSDSCEAEIGLAKCFYSVIRSMSRCSKFSYEWGNGLIFRPSPGCLRTAYSKTIWMTVFSWGSTDVICEEKWKERKGFAFDTVSIFNLRILACCCLKAWLNWEILLHTQVFLSLTMWKVNVEDSRATIIFKVLKYTVLVDIAFSLCRREQRNRGAKIRRRRYTRARNYAFWR